MRGRPTRGPSVNEGILEPCKRSAARGPPAVMALLCPVSRWRGRPTRGPSVNEGILEPASEAPHAARQRRRPHSAQSLEGAAEVLRGKSSSLRHGDHRDPVRSRRGRPTRGPSVNEGIFEPASEAPQAARQRRWPHSAQSLEGAAERLSGRFPYIRAASGRTRRAGGARGSVLARRDCILPDAAPLELSFAALRGEVPP